MICTFRARDHSSNSCARISTSMRNKGEMQSHMINSSEAAVTGVSGNRYRVRACSSIPRNMASAVICANGSA